MKPQQIPQHIEEYFIDLREKEKIDLSAGQKNWYFRQWSILGDKIKQEYPSTATEAFVYSQDAYFYAIELQEARKDRRLIPLRYNPEHLVYVSFDIGVFDHTVLWFYQVFDQNVYFIDYYEDNNKAYDFYVQHMLQNKSYHYGTVFLPHDAAKRDEVTLLSYADKVRKLFSEKHIDVTVLKKDDPIIGINVVKVLMNSCYIDENKCAQGIDHLTKYKRKWKEEAGWIHEPMHTIHSHACVVGDTLVDTIKGQKQIKNIKAGDLVKTPNGYKKVLNRFLHRSKELYNINNTLTCTGNHKILTQNGLSYCDTLRYGDILFHNSSWGNYIWKIRFGSTEENIGFREAFTLACAGHMSYSMGKIGDGMDIITNPEGIGVISTAYIGQFGQSVMVQYLKDITSIIKMGMQKIMKLKISNVCRHLNIYHKLPRRVNGLEVRRTNRTSLKHEEKPNYGTHLKRVCSGIEKTVGKHGKNAFGIKRCVLFVVKNMKLLFRRSQSFVEIIANQSTEEIQESITPTETAKYVQKNSKLTNILPYGRVQSLVPLNLLEEQDVYDLEVEDDHCYYANGILVSNSDSMRYAALSLDIIRRKSHDYLDKHRKAVESSSRLV